MKMVIGVNYEDVYKVKNMFSNLTIFKGRLPHMTCCYDLVNNHKYVIEGMSAYPDPKYPSNVIDDLYEVYETCDILCVPLDMALINTLTKTKRFKNVFIYEEDPSSQDINSRMLDEYYDHQYMLNNKIDDDIHHDERWWS